MKKLLFVTALAAVSFVACEKSTDQLETQVAQESLGLETSSEIYQYYVNNYNNGEQLKSSDLISEEEIVSHLNVISNVFSATHSSNKKLVNMHSEVVAFENEGITSTSELYEFASVSAKKVNEIKAKKVKSEVLKFISVSIENGDILYKLHFGEVANPDKAPAPARLLDLNCRNYFNDPNSNKLLFSQPSVDQTNFGCWRSEENPNGFGFPSEIILEYEIEEFWQQHVFTPCTKAFIQVIDLEMDIDYYNPEDQAVYDEGIFPYLLDYSSANDLCLKTEDREAILNYTYAKLTASGMAPLNVGDDWETSAEVGFKETPTSPHPHNSGYLYIEADVTVFLCLDNPLGPCVNC